MKTIALIMAVSMIMLSSTFAIAYETEESQEAQPIVVSIDPSFEAEQITQTQSEEVTDEAAQEYESIAPNLSDEDKKEIAEQAGDASEEMFEKVFDYIDSTNDSVFYKVLPDGNLLSPNGEIIDTSEPKTTIERISDWITNSAQEGQDLIAGFIDSVS